MPQELKNIKEFRKNSVAIFVNEILEKLKPFEAERTTVRKKCIKFALCFTAAFVFSAIILIYLLIAGVAKAYETIVGLFLLIDGLLLPCLLAVPIIEAKSFENRIKSGIMPIVLSSLKNFQWTEKSRIKDEQIDKFKLFRPIYRRQDDDNFFW